MIRESKIEIILFVILIITFSPVLYSSPNGFNAIISEDSSIDFPDSIMLDRFEIKTEHIDDNLYWLTLAYYGNQSMPYQVFVGISDLAYVNYGYVIPVDFRSRINSSIPADVIVSLEKNLAGICIPPVGPRNGVEILDVMLDLNAERDLPEIASTQLGIKLIVL